MADRYQNRPFRADHHDRDNGPHGGESDPLAELARLIGQTDPLAGMGRVNQKPQPRNSRDQYEPFAEQDDGSSAAPPPWMQRAGLQEPPRDDPRSAEHPLRRYAAPPPPEPSYEEAQPFEVADQQYDRSRYDEALYGALDSGVQDTRYSESYSDDPYAYPEGYGEAAEDQPRKRRGGMATVLFVLALAVVGTGAALAYRTYFGPSRTGEPPIIRADNSPTKIVPSPSDGTAKLPDRLAAADSTEKIVPREEAPVDVNAKTAPRVVFPPLNHNGDPWPAASTPPPASTGNGALPNVDPRRIKTLSVRGDQPDGGAAPATATTAAAPKPAPAAKTTVAAVGAKGLGSSASANASAAGPLSLAPQSAEPIQTAPATRVAATNPVQPVSNAGSSGGYLVQVSSQRNEADAQASFRALQGKFPTVLGSRHPVIKRADLGEKGVYYRAMVGPFGSPDEASQFCGKLKTAGGQCVVQRN